MLLYHFSLMTVLGKTASLTVCARCEQYLKQPRQAGRGSGGILCLHHRLYKPGLDAGGHPGPRQTADLPGEWVLSDGVLALLYASTLCTVPVNVLRHGYYLSYV